MVRTFQNRLGKYHDNLRRKLLDNNISLTGSAADCIRVRAKKSKQGDTVTRVVEDAEVISVIFPVLKDVPYRRMAKVDGSSSFTMETLPSIMDLFPFEIISTQVGKIYQGDLIFRILLEPGALEPMVMALEVTEPKGTFGSASMIYAKFDCVYYNEVLPPEVLETVAMLARRRMALGW
jgi:hypothetical protein